MPSFLTQGSSLLSRVTRTNFPKTNAIVNSRKKASAPSTTILNGVDSLDRSVPIVDFGSLRKSVFREFVDHESLKGISWKRFPALTKILKGHREGELTVMSGPTGSGKTTFLSEASLDLCMQGVRTLWGSFEVKNVRLLKMMMTQFAKMKIQDDLESFDIVADAFSTLPMFFMDFHGEQSLSSVLDTMSHAVAQHDINHILIDNLQFMIGNECNKHLAGMNRFDYQDIIVGSMRKFATQHNCHITLVIHPKKTSAGEELTNNSIFGGAKAIQEADNIILLQVKYLNGNNSLKFRKFLQVTKNRFDGDLGIIPLQFDKQALSFGVTMPSVPNALRSEFASTAFSHHDLIR